MTSLGLSSISKTEKGCVDLRGMPNIYQLEF